MGWGISLLMDSIEGIGSPKERIRGLDQYKT